MKQFVYVSNSPEQTQHVGRRCSAWLQAGDCIPLVGDLGSGKTCFVKGVAEGLGIGDVMMVHSPSFTLINRYDTRIPLYHVDLYRLQSSRDIDDLELMDIISENAVTLIEWPRFILESLKQIPLHIEFTWNMSSENVRTLTFTGSSRFDAFFRSLANENSGH